MSRMHNSSRRETMSFLMPVHRPNAEEMGQPSTRRRAHTQMLTTDASPWRNLDRGPVLNKVISMEAGRRAETEEVPNERNNDQGLLSRIPYNFENLIKNKLGAIFLKSSHRHLGGMAASVIQSSTSTGSKLQSGEKGKPYASTIEGEKTAANTEDKHTQPRTHQLVKIAMHKPDEDSSPMLNSRKPFQKDRPSLETVSNLVNKSVQNANVQFSQFQEKLFFTNLIEADDRIIAKNSKIVMQDGLEKIVSCLIWQSGTTFEGEIANMKFQGFGKLHHHSGYTIKGSFEGGMVQGRAEFYSAKKSYTGQWKDNVPHGSGLERVEGVYEYLGEFVDGLKNGKGRMQILNKGVYEGSFRANCFHGQGTFLWEDGRKYTGTWFINCMHGKGLMTWPDGRRYEGRYVKNKKEGYGSFTWADGRVFAGLWKNGKQHGQGKYLNLKGTRNEAQWDHGHLQRTNGFTTTEGLD